MTLKNSNSLTDSVCLNNSFKYWALNLLDITYRDWLAKEYGGRLLDFNTKIIFKDPQQLMLFTLRFSDSIDDPI